MLADTQQEDQPPAVLEVAGKQILLNQPLVDRGNQIAFLKVDIEGIGIWPEDRIRPASEPEDCLVFTGGAIAPRALAAIHLKAQENNWTVM